MSVTVLNYARRFVCGECGAHSRRNSQAGNMLATPYGWRCPECWAAAEVVQTQARDFEPAPLGTTISAGASE